jgi:hypothetical protein
LLSGLKLKDNWPLMIPYRPGLFIEDMPGPHRIYFAEYSFAKTGFKKAGSESDDTTDEGAGVA